MAAWELLIEPRQRSVGSGFVDRLLPFRKRRMVGPFIFADLMGPEDLAPGVGSDVAVHPHLGLATVTNLFDGALVHRDSTGITQEIRPGAVNWMTAGSGVTHSERTPDWVRDQQATMAGLQTWVALPDDAEDVEPSFVHAEVPRLDVDGTTVGLVAGAFGGADAPFATYSPLFYLDIEFGDGSVELPSSLGERAVVVIDGEVRADGTPIPHRHLAVIDASSANLTGRPGARAIAFGGEPIGERFIDWNFVASSKQRLIEARDRWREFDFPLVADDDELIPYPNV